MIRRENFFVLSHAVKPKVELIPTQSAKAQPVDDQSIMTKVRHFPKITQHPKISSEIELCGALVAITY